MSGCSITRGTARFHTVGGPRRRLTGLLVAAVLVGCGTDNPAGPSSTTGPRDPSTSDGPVGRIVIEAGSGDSIHLVEVDAATGGRTRLVDQPAVHPRVSPDGEMVAFGTWNPSGEVWVVDRRGEARLVGRGSCPGWSGDSLLVAESGGGLVCLGLDGQVVERLVEEPEAWCGTHLDDDEVVTSSETDRLMLLRGGASEALVTMSDCGLGPVGVRAGRREIAFTAACDDERSGLFVLDLDDRRPDQVLTGDAYGASWSPDGEWLATAWMEPDQERFQLTLVRADGTDRQVIDTGPEEVNNPSWGPVP